MLTKEQYLYQAKLIIDCFPKEEYEQIPQGILEYIEENMKEDPNIVINPNVSLEEQDIDPQTLKLLKNIINIVDENNFYEEYKKELNEYLENVIEQNRGFEARIDNINLNKKRGSCKLLYCNIPLFYVLGNYNLIYLTKIVEISINFKDSIKINRKI